MAELTYHLGELKELGYHVVIAGNEATVYLHGNGVTTLYRYSSREPWRFKSNNRRAVKSDFEWSLKRSFKTVR